MTTFYSVSIIQWVYPSSMAPTVGILYLEINSHYDYNRTKDTSFAVLEGSLGDFIFLIIGDI